MPTVTVSIPEDLKHTMDDFPDINWSAVAREAIKKRIELLRKFSEFSKQSSLNEEDAVALGKKVNVSLAKRLAK